MGRRIQGLIPAGTLAVPVLRAFGEEEFSSVATSQTVLFTLRQKTNL